MSLRFLCYPRPSTQFRFFPQVSLRGSFPCSSGWSFYFYQQALAIWDRNFTRVIQTLLKPRTLQLDTPNWVEIRIFSKGFDFSPLHPFLNSIQVKINTSTFSNVNSEPVASCVAAVNRLQDRLRGKISVSLKIDQLKTLKIVQALLPCPALCAGICSVL